MTNVVETLHHAVVPAAIETEIEKGTDRPNMTAAAAVKVHGGTGRRTMEDLQAERL